MIILSLSFDLIRKHLHQIDIYIHVYVHVAIKLKCLLLSGTLYIFCSVSEHLHVYI